MAVEKTWVLNYQKVAINLFHEQRICVVPERNMATNATQWFITTVGTGSRLSDLYDSKEQAEEALVEFVLGGLPAMFFVPKEPPANNVK